ncbi:hypothetical protein HZB60_06600 [candidate division KSB1 bacterium]|nr:hypothetical protein [candidate division KSB1 bacterium]
MRRFLPLLLIIFVALFVGGARAEDKPDWGYTWIDAHYVPDNAPDELKSFHEVFIPMLEARGSAESAYLREHADNMYRLSKQVRGSWNSDDGDLRKHFNRAAHDLVSHCAKLREQAFGGSSPVVYQTMKDVEHDYLRLANLCE